MTTHTVLVQLCEFPGEDLNAMCILIIAQYIFVMAKSIDTNSIKSLHCATCI